MAQPDSQMALQMAQQEMEYRVELFNKWVMRGISCDRPYRRHAASAAAAAWREFELRDKALTCSLCSSGVQDGLQLL
jgi:hypothetical protein